MAPTGRLNRAGGPEPVGLKYSAIFPCLAEPSGGVPSSRGPVNCASDATRLLRVPYIWRPDIGPFLVFLVPSLSFPVLLFDNLFIYFYFFLLFWLRILLARQGRACGGAQVGTHRKHPPPPKPSFLSLGRSLVLSRPALSAVCPSTRDTRAVPQIASFDAAIGCCGVMGGAG